MALPSYTPEQRRDLAEKLGLAEQYVYQVLTAKRIASPVLARRIHRADGRARLQDLRPHDWHVIWPELIGAEQVKAGA